MTFRYSKSGLRENSSGQMKDDREKTEISRKVKNVLRGLCSQGHAWSARGNSRVKRASRKRFRT